MKNIYIAIGFFLFMTSCYREVINIEPDADTFTMLVTPDQQNFIYTSRDTSYSIEDPDLSLFFNDQLLDLKEIRVRGKSALRFQRKSYAVFLRAPITVKNRYEEAVKSLSRFKLLALTMDYTYIENRVAFGILEEAGVMPLFYKFVEFRINDETQGVYLLIEDPEQYYKEHESEYILRRGYNHRIDDSDYTPSSYFKSIEAYEHRFKELYTSLPDYQGQDLYKEISGKLDIEQYFRKMGIDFLLKNGDYTDEIYFYALVERDTIRYNVIPWDYDDIFRDVPHEVGVSWGMGTLFGKRSYATLQDIYDEIGEKLIFSIEDDLDYTIAKDSFLYSCYEKTLSGLLMEIDEDVIERIFEETAAELATFYNSISVVEQSYYDSDVTNRKLWEKNMEEKQAFLKERLEWIRQQLEKSVQ